MTDKLHGPQQQDAEGRPRDDAPHWASYVETLELPEGAVSPSVEGRRPVGPLQGFGQMWQKVFEVRLEGVSVSPAEVVGTWRERFPEISGFGKNFRVPSGGLVPGAVALLGGGLTGVMVLYADEESFTYMTPEGHPFSGWITFCAHEDADGTTVAQARLLIRANDPLYELMMAAGLNWAENLQWQGTLRNLAAHFGAAVRVETRVACVDPRRQWRRYKNIRHNVLIRSAVRAPGDLIRSVARSGANRH